MLALSEIFANDFCDMHELVAIVIDRAVVG